MERKAKVLELTRDLYYGLAISPIELMRKQVEQKIRTGDQFIQEIIDKGVES